MKIIFVTREDYRLAGARVRCYNFARELAARGFETEVFSFAADLGAECAEFEARMRLRTKLAYNLAAFRRLLGRNRRSVFYIQRFNYHALAPLAVSLFKGNKVVFDCDDWNIREDPAYRFGVWPSSKMEYCTRTLASRARLCVAASTYLKEYLARFNRRVSYIPTGVDTDRFFPRPGNAPSGIRFSWIGTAYHPEMKANLDFIISCFSHLAEKYGTVSLSLAGEGRYFREMSANARRLPWADRIFFHPWIHPDAVPEYLAGIDIGLVPLIQDSRFNKAKSPTKLFEYMAMAKPVVASDIGEAGSIIRSGASGFLARGREDFIGKMSALVEDGQLRQDMGERARRDVEAKYSLKVLSGRLADILACV